jgi:hypothetical protein
VPYHCVLVERIECLAEIQLLGLPQEADDIAMLLAAVTAECARRGIYGQGRVVVLMEPAEPERLLRCHSEAILATDAHNLRRCSGLTVGYVWVQERLGA